MATTTTMTDPRIRRLAGSAGAAIRGATGDAMAGRHRRRVLVVSSCRSAQRFDNAILKGSALLNWYARRL